MIERLDMEEKYNATEAAIHINRYEIAKQFCKDKKVLDISCGEGYGSYLISKWGAKEVIGIDISDTAINKAKSNFKNKNLKYFVKDATNLTDINDNSFDLVISFETFEHIENCDEYLKEIKRVSKKDAIIVISCPNDYYYYPSDNEKNPYHIRKYTFDEFKNKAEKVLGKNVSYMTGMEVMGYVNTIPNKKLKINKNSDMINQENQINCIKIYSGKEQDFSHCNYYVGIWNAKNFGENSVIYPYMYTDWKEALDIYKKDIEIYKKDIQSLNNKIEEMIRENEKIKVINKLFNAQNEESIKFSSNIYNDYIQTKAQLDSILNSRSYKWTRKLVKLVKKK